jgi:hypothetical protein
MDNVVAIQYALGNNENFMNFAENGVSGFVSNKGASKVKVTTVDNFVEKNQLNLGLLKMDLEGYELEAIKGAERAIKKFKPVLLVCLYHSGKDFFEIPTLVKKWVDDYEFRFLNINHSNPMVDKIMVAY